MASLRSFRRKGTALSFLEERNITVSSQLSPQSREALAQRKCKVEIGVDDIFPEPDQETQEVILIVPLAVEAKLELQKMKQLRNNINGLLVRYANAGNNAETRVQQAYFPAEQKAKAPLTTDKTPLAATKTPLAATKTPLAPTKTPLVARTPLAETQTPLAVHDGTTPLAGNGMFTPLADARTPLRTVSPTEKENTLTTQNR